MDSILITVWRHGKAGSAPRDADRALTTRGRDDVSRGAAALAHTCGRRGVVPPDALWFSRWRRTRETAGIIVEGLDLSVSESAEVLIPGASPDAVENSLVTLWERGTPPAHLVLVSHQPLVSALVDRWLGSPGVAPSLPPGGLVTLELASPTQGAGRLCWWAFPPLFEASA